MSIYFKGVKVSSGAPEVQRDVLIQTIGLASNTQDGIMSKEDKIILNAIDTVYEKKNDAETDFAHSLDISQVESTGVVTISIKNLKGEVIDTDTLDLDTEHIIVSAILDYANKKIIFTLKNGSTIDCDISNLIDTLQGAITAEKERAEAKELSLSNRINQEVTDREKAITKAINDLDVDPVGGNEQYIKVVKQTDGKIIATAQTFDKAINNEIVTDNNVPSSLAVKTFVDNSIKALDKDQVGSGNNVSIITSISEADGIITATSEDRKGTINGETDQLVTEKGIKTFVNSSIENMAAFYVTYNAEGDAFPTRQSLTTATELYIGGVKLTKAPGKNDYCIVTADESKQGELAQAPTTKYTYTKTNEEIYDSNAWSYLYTVNSTGFTSAQMAAINSGITKDTRFDNIAYADKKLTKTINGNQSDVVTINTIKTDLDLNTTINNLGSSKTLKAITETSGIITVEQQDISIKTNQINDITATASELNVLDGITATTTELNYTDGVTSNIQTQLNDKVNKAGDTLSGGLTTTLVSGTYGEFKATRNNNSIWFGIGSGNVNRGIYDDTLNKWIVYTDGTNVYLDGKTLGKSVPSDAKFTDTVTTATTTGSGNAVTAISASNGALTVTKGTTFSTTDTKNTAGSTDTSSKIFLIGATSQATSPQTYSDNEIYATNGVLTTKSVQVGGDKATMQYNSSDESIEFIF